jgi:hypothetical protein
MANGHPTHDEPVTGLRATLEAAMAEDGYKMKDLTVLANQNDPFRVDTPAGHRDGAWLAIYAAKLPDDRRIHLRGLHYMVLGEPKPDGTPYTNTDANWVWVQSKAGKAARWLGYIPFEKITDERNSPPVVRLFEQPNPTSYIGVGGVEISVPDDLAPEPLLSDFRGVQPYKLVLFGEKTSLEEVLAPIAEARRADLYLPTGNASDTMIYEMARVGAEDGRPMVVFYLSDCDPAGWNMAVEVARKLQAAKALSFSELEFEVRPIALTPDQVHEYGLPSTPLKDTERRGDKWKQAMGVEQTEIDALATLRPDLLRRIVLKATAPFFDSGLDERVRRARREWEAEAQRKLEAEIGEEQLAQLRADAEQKLVDLEVQVEALNNALTVDEVEGLELPETPDVVEGTAEVDGLPSPLIDSGWGFIDQCQKLISHKAYENGNK